VPHPLPPLVAGFTLSEADGSQPCVRDRLQDRAPLATIVGGASLFRVVRPGRVVMSGCDLTRCQARPSDTAGVVARFRARSGYGTHVGIGCVI
jgi:hypothetical protein